MSLSRLVSLLPAVLALSACTPPGFSPKRAAASSAASHQPAGPVSSNETGESGQRVPRPAVISAISLEEGFQLQQGGQVLFLDARPSFLYHLGHIPGAIQVSLGQVDRFLVDHASQLRALHARGHRLVTYCSSSSCPDAGLLARRLAEDGLPVAVLSDGWSAWREADLPVSRDTSRISADLPVSASPSSSRTTIP